MLQLNKEFRVEVSNVVPFFVGAMKIRPEELLLLSWTGLNLYFQHLRSYESLIQK